MLASFYIGNLSYTSRTGFILIWGVSLTHPMLALFLCGEFLLYIPCCLHFYAGSFSYTSRAVFIFIHDVSLTHPMPASSFFFNLRIVSYIPRAGFVVVFYMKGVSLTHHVLASFLSGEFLLHIPF